MSTNLTAVIVGAPAVADALNRTGQFAAVIAAGSTGALRDLLASGKVSKNVDDKVFLFSDLTPVNTPQSLPTLLTKLAAAGARVAVIATGPAGAHLIEQSPGAGLLSGDLHVNTVLAGIAGLPGVSGLHPVDDVHNVRLDLPAPAETPLAGPSGGPVPGQQVPAARREAPAAPANPFGIGFQEPPAAPAPRRPVSTNPITAPPDGYTQAAPDPFATQTPDWSAAGVPRPRPGAAADKPTRLGKVITVTAPKGGIGKSSTTLNLAAFLGIALKGTGRNVCVMDANVQQADSGKYLNEHRPNVEELLRNVNDIHPDRIGAHLVHKPQWNLSALLGPPEPLNASPMHYSGKRYAGILEALKPNFDYIFIDTPVAELYHDMFRVFALPYADYILVLAEPNYTTLYDIDMWLRAITTDTAGGGIGVDRNKIGILLNRAEDGIDCSEDDVRENLAGWAYLGSIPETKEMKRANNNNELLATKSELVNIHQAFALVLQQITGEQLINDENLARAARSGGLPAALRRLFGMGGRK